MNNSDGRFERDREAGLLIAQLKEQLWELSKLLLRIVNYLNLYF